MAYLTNGAFKELYRGEGIYWRSTYNVEGRGDYRTLEEARAAIDAYWTERAARLLDAEDARLVAGSILAVRKGDSITVNFPEGPRTMSMREYRTTVFQLEEQYATDFVIR